MHRCIVILSNGLVRRLSKTLPTPLYRHFRFSPAFIGHRFSRPSSPKWFYDIMNDATMYNQQSAVPHKRNDFLQFLFDRKLIKQHSDARVVEFAVTFFFDA